MLTTPKGMRLHIGVFGRRNAGKSSLFNRLLGQDCAIVSDQPGTTTDPIEKAMELDPLGPILLMDTAGIDDEGMLGELRVQKTQHLFDRIDMAILVVDEWTAHDQALVDLFAKRKVPAIVACNKADIRPDRTLEEAVKAAVTLEVVTVSAGSGDGLDSLRDAIIRSAPEEFCTPPTILGDLIPPGGLVILVTPIDKEAPKGRLILPQVQVLRDILDNDGYALVVKERELAPALQSLKKPPALVVTDSQAFLKVSADIPKEIPLTSFSILFARYRGDLIAMTKGAAAIRTLKPGARILIAEACAHHAITDDIGRVKIPRWIEQYTGNHMEFVHYSGQDFPADLASFDLIIHCGGCIINRQTLLRRIQKAHAQSVPLTNYGLAISCCMGIIERALQPFPAALRIWQAVKTGGKAATAGAPS